MARHIASYFIVAALAVAALVPRPASADNVSFVFGGATSFSDMATGSLVPNYRAAAVGPYQAVGSALGIDRFKSGVYGFGVSDDAMSVADEQSLPGGASFKLTIPLVVSTYSFFVGAALAKGTVKLDALQTFNIYKRGSGQLWATYTKALRGTIVRVARADGSGTSLIVKKYWLDILSNARTAAAASFPGKPDESPFQFPGLVLKNGGSAVCSYAAATKGSIVYSQTGTCLKFNTPRLTNLSEVALKNAAVPAVYVTASGFQTNAMQILPRPQPGATAPWAGVRTIFQRGAATFPIVSLIFTFIRAQQTQLGPKAGLALRFLMWCTSNSSAYASSYFFAALPAAWVSANLNALAKVM